MGGGIYLKKLFEKEIYENPVNMYIVSRASDNNGKSIKPKELKGIKQCAKVISRGKSFQLFIDNEFNLWYKDNSFIAGKDIQLINNEIKSITYLDKVWFKFSGIYERRNQFILDTVSEMCDVSEKIYTDNTIADNIALEDIYTELLKSYLNTLNSCNIN